MELVSPTSTALSQGIKTMHPQGGSASLSQQPHIPQSLSNMHTNTTAAHSYTNQHSFSLNITSSTAGPFNQSQEQAPASNHPVANPGGGQTFVQKNMNAAPSNQAPIATVEQALPETSQSNGTSDEAPPKSSKESPVASQGPSVACTQVDAPTVENKASAPSLPVQAKPDDTESVVDGASKLVVPETKVEAQDKAENKAEELDEKLDSLAKPTKKTEPEQVQVKLDADCINDIAATPDSDPLKTPTDVVKEEVVPKQVKATPRKVKAPQDQEPKAGTSASTPATQNAAKRQRMRTQHYQSPLPEVELVSKISSSSARSNDEKLMVFYKNEFLAVRNAEGGFYLCQAVQNIYKTSSKIKIRWLSQTKNDDKGEEYTPDFYDLIDFDCILTNLSLNKADKGKFILPSSEKARTQSILNRSLAVEKGEEVVAPSLTAEHPDGLDLSLYRDEDQLKKRKARKRPRKASPTVPPKQPPVKKSPKAPKAKKPNPPPKKATATPRRPTPSTSTATSTVSKTASKVSSKAGSKLLTKSNPVVDHKKAKVIARIGRKAALATSSKSPKNGKSGNKVVAAFNKAAQPKASPSAKTTTRSLRKSTRK